MRLPCQIPTAQNRHACLIPRRRSLCWPSSGKGPNMHMLCAPNTLRRLLLPSLCYRSILARAYRTNGSRTGLRPSALHASPLHLQTSSVLHVILPPNPLHPAPTFSPRAATHSCPFNLQPDGKLQLCSGRGTTDTCPHGTCTCAPPYAPPPNWVMTPGTTPPATLACRRSHSMSQPVTGPHPWRTLSSGILQPVRITTKACPRALA